MRTMTNQSTEHPPRSASPSAGALSAKARTEADEPDWHQATRVAADELVRVAKQALASANLFRRELGLPPMHVRAAQQPPGTRRKPA
jgi:hypothetical protein